MSEKQSVLDQLLSGIDYLPPQVKYLWLVFFLWLTGCAEMQQTSVSTLCPAQKDLHCSVGVNEEGEPHLLIRTAGGEIVQFNYEKFESSLQQALELWANAYGLPEGYKMKMPSTSLEEDCEWPFDKMETCFVVKPRDDFGGGLNFPLRMADMGEVVQPISPLTTLDQAILGKTPDWLALYNGPVIQVFDGALGGKQVVPLSAFLTAIGGGNPVHYEEAIKEALKTVGIEWDLPDRIQEDTTGSTTSPEIAINIRPTTTVDSVPQSGQDVEKNFIMEIYVDNKVTILLSVCFLVLAGVVTVLATEIVKG